MFLGSLIDAWGVGFRDKKPCRRIGRALVLHWKKKGDALAEQWNIGNEVSAQVGTFFVGFYLKTIVQKLFKEKL